MCDDIEIASGADEKTKKRRDWMITRNNWDDEDLKTIEDCKAQAKYMKWQFEQGEECGTPHFHLYIYWEHPNRFSTMKELFPKAFIERPRSALACIKYCGKEETRTDGPYEFGVCPKQGRRTDIEEAYEDLEKGISEREFVKKHTGVAMKYPRGVKEVKSALMSERDPNNAPEVRWYYGPTGSRKTSSVFRDFATVYVKDNTIWWDGYKQQSCILIDDFDMKSWNFRDLLRLLDRYPYQGQVKGGYVQINSPFIIITCEHHPNNYWQGSEYAQMCRRIRLCRKHTPKEEVCQMIEEDD